jgi:hypothetical protein
MLFLSPFFSFEAFIHVPSLSLLLLSGVHKSMERAGNQSVPYGESVSVDKMNSVTRDSAREHCCQFVLVQSE